MKRASMTKLLTREDTVESTLEEKKNVPEWKIRQRSMKLREQSFIEFKRTEDNVAIRPLFHDQKVADAMTSLSLDIGNRPMMVNNLLGVYDGIVSERGFYDEPLTPLGMALEDELEELRIVAAEEQKEIDEIRESAKHGNIKTFKVALDNLQEEEEQQQLEKIGCPPDGKWSSLIWSSHLDHQFIARELVKQGVNPDYEDSKGWTALMWAAHQNNHELVQFLLTAAKASPNHQNKYGVTALMWAAHQGNLQSVNILLDNGASVNHQSEDHSTPLIWACRSGSTDVARRLTERGAELNRVNKALETPLICAVQAGHLDTAKFLLSLEGKCDLRCRNKYSQSALDLAELLGVGPVRSELIEVLNESLRKLPPIEAGEEEKQASRKEKRRNRMSAIFQRKSVSK